jgi:hypothetical protein
MNTKLTWYRVLGGVVVFAIIAVSIVLSPRYPWITVPANALCWYIGKALGIPVEPIIQAALRAMQPERVADIAVKAIASMPPEAQTTATGRIIASIRPAANGAANVRAIKFEGTGGEDP